MKISVYRLLAVFLVLAAASYYLPGRENRKSPALATIKVGILPDESVEQIRARFAPLLGYLATETGWEFSLIESSDYDQLVDLFVQDRVDLAYLGGYTFVQSHILHNAVPLVMRELDTRFTSYFLAAGGNPSQQLQDFKGKKFSFGNRLSTSGHLMPRYFMGREQAIVPEDFFSEIQFSGAHDATAYLVRDGDVDLGVANSEIIRSMLRDGRLKEDDLRIIWETPPFADYVWAVQENLPEEVKIRLRDAFLALDINDEGEAKILQSVGARVFLPSGMSDFGPLRQVAESLQLLSTESK